MADQLHGVAFGQLFADNLAHGDLDGAHRLGRMIGAPIEGGNCFDEGLGIVVIERAFIYDNAWFSYIDP